jgi:hypothetical protein
LFDNKDNPLIAGYLAKDGGVYYSNGKRINVQSNPRIYDEFLRNLGAKASAIQSSTGWDEPRYGVINLSRCLKGLKGIAADSDAVKAVLSALAAKILSAGNFDAQAVGNSLYGLQNMSADSDAVKAILRALAAKIISAGNLDAQAFGNALYGLQNMSADSPEVKAVLLALAAKIPGAGVLSGQEVGNAIYGLQNMSADSDAVKAVLRALAAKIPGAGVLNGQEVGNALYGLQNKGYTGEVRAVLKALSTKITSEMILNGQEVGNALYGIKGFDYEHTSIKDIVSKIEAKMPPITYNSLEWKQIVASYIVMQESTKSKSNQEHRVLTGERLGRLFPGKAFTLTKRADELVCDVKQHFAEVLARTHVINNTQLDLHNLDHASAGILLENIDLTNIRQIIWGKGSHSSASHSSTMQNMARVILQRRGSAVTADPNNPGRANITKAPLGTGRYTNNAAGLCHHSGSPKRERSEVELTSAKRPSNSTQKKSPLSNSPPTKVSSSWSGNIFSKEEAKNWVNNIEISKIVHKDHAPAA